MPKFNRRSFLHMIGAASLAPAIPALPARAAATGGATHAQLLWASLYGRAGSASNFTRLTKGLGISAHTAHRLQTKLAGSRIVLAKGAVRANSAARPTPQTVKAPATGEATPKQSFSDARKLWAEDRDIEPNSVETDDTEDQQQDEAADKLGDPD